MRLLRLVRQRKSFKSFAFNSGARSESHPLRHSTNSIAATALGLVEGGVVGTADVKVAYAAFTVAELGMLLPRHVGCYRGDDGNEDGDNEESCCLNFAPGDHSKYQHCQWAETEADARARMLVHLLRGVRRTLVPKNG